jgi:predicted RNase H-like HicB family nuclease
LSRCKDVSLQQSKLDNYELHYVYYSPDIVGVTAARMDYTVRMRNEETSIEFWLENLMEHEGRWKK